MSEYLKKDKKLMSEYNYDKNKNINLDSLKLGSEKKIWWRCNKGHEWQSSVNHKSRGQGCPYCSNRKILKGYNDLATTHPNIAKEWNYEKNENILPSDIIAGSNKKYWWKCSKGHEWQTSPNNRLRGTGCPYCVNLKILKGYNDLATTHPNIAKEWDYEKNNPLTPDKVISGSTKKVWWKCKNGHTFNSSIVSRKKGKGCPYCANKKVIIGSNDLSTINPKLAQEWNYERNSPLTPKDVIAGSTKKVWWKCSKGHEWQASIVSRNRGHFCPLCDQGKHTSISEKAFVFYLKKAGIIVEENKKINKREVDIFIPNLNLAIEYDGVHYHKDLEKDLIKNEIFNKAGIKLIRIREPGLPVIKDGCISILIDKLTSNYVYLNKPIIDVLKYLNIRNIDVDVDRDLNEIYTIFQLGDKENNIFLMYPLLEKEWDYTKNIIDPMTVTKGQHLKIWWKCSICGHEWQSMVYSRCMGNNCPKCAQIHFGDYRKRKVNQYDKNGNYIKTFDSITEAEKISGTKNIFYACVGKRNTAGGYIWKYADEEK